MKLKFVIIAVMFLISIGLTVGQYNFPNCRTIHGQCKEDKECCSGRCVEWEPNARSCGNEDNRNDVFKKK
uniref:Teratocyte stigma-specific protein n=1 Tax=Cotesia flavipes TaxID=89805 RepID=A0A8K1YTU1_COTFL|nr:teratocyte stigma-specific protein [Cotesia flavipes]